MWNDSRLFREITKVDDILKVITKAKWKWAGHVARMSDKRWTVRCTEWQVRHGKRSRGKPRRRWHDDIQQWQGVTWSRKSERSTTVEGRSLVSVSRRRRLSHSASKLQKKFII